MTGPLALVIPVALTILTLLLVIMRNNPKNHGYVYSRRVEILSSVFILISTFAWFLYTVTLLYQIPSRLPSGADPILSSYYFRQYYLIIAASMFFVTVSILRVIQTDTLPLMRMFFFLGAGLILSFVHPLTGQANLFLSSLYFMVLVFAPIRITVSLVMDNKNTSSEFMLYPFRGRSMLPTIESGEFLILSTKMKPYEPKVGEIVDLAYPLRLQIAVPRVAHRIIEVNGDKFISKGDSMQGSQISLSIGKINHVVVGKINPMTGEYTPFLQDERKNPAMNAAVFEALENRMHQILGPHTFPASAFLLIGLAFSQILWWATYYI